MAFVATADLVAARAFYLEMLGGRVIEESPFACVVDARGTQLRITPVETVAAAPYTVLGWQVADIAGSVAGLETRGAQWERFAGMDQDGAGIWTASDGARVAWCRDPDGNLLSLSQAAATGR